MSRLLLVALAAAAATSAAPAPPAAVESAAVLAAGAKAARYWTAKTPMDNNEWTGSTFAIGLMEYYKASKAAGAEDAGAAWCRVTWVRQSRQYSRILGKVAMHVPYASATMIWVMQSRQYQDLG